MQSREPEHRELLLRQLYLLVLHGRLQTWVRRLYRYEAVRTFLLFIKQRVIALKRPLQLLNIVSFLVFLIVYVSGVDFSHAVVDVFAGVGVLAAVEEARVANIGHVDLFLLVVLPGNVITILITCSKHVVSVAHPAAKRICVIIILIIVIDLGMVPVIALLMKRRSVISLAMSVVAAARAAAHGALQVIPHATTKSDCLVIVESFLRTLSVGLIQAQIIVLS